MLGIGYDHRCSWIRWGPIWINGLRGDGPLEKRANALIRSQVFVEKRKARILMTAPETKWYRDQVTSVTDLIENSPIVEIFFKTFTYEG
jgi:hypothetical protein